MPSSLQIIIPAVIGLAAAAIIAVVYTRRKTPATDESTSKKTKPKATATTKPKSEDQPRNP